MTTVSNNCYLCSTLDAFHKGPDLYAPLKASQLILQKKHASMDDMKLLMKLPNESDAIFNTRGKLNGK